MKAGLRSQRSIKELIIGSENDGGRPCYFYPVNEVNELCLDRENGYLCIDEELELFSNIKGRELYSQANKTLLMRDGERFIEDTFAHEQNLIITIAEISVLIAGCAHNCIVNSINRFTQMKGSAPAFVIGGFHLFNPGTGKSEDPELISKIGKVLNESGSQFFTCHCTGSEAFEQLKTIMKDNIQYLATGAVVEIYKEHKGDTKNE